MVVPATLVVLTGTTPNPRDVFESTAGKTPVAVNDAVSGLFEALVVTVRLPAGPAPRTVGVKVTDIPQKEFAAKVLPHVVPETA